MKNLNKNHVGVNSRQRIGISRGQIVVLLETRPGQYHGYTCEYELLHPDLQEFLKNVKLVNSRGKIL